MKKGARLPILQQVRNCRANDAHELPLRRKNGLGKFPARQGKRHTIQNSWAEADSQAFVIKEVFASSPHNALSPKRHFPFSRIFFRSRHAAQGLPSRNFGLCEPAAASATSRLGHKGRSSPAGRSFFLWPRCHHRFCALSAVPPIRRPRREEPAATLHGAEAPELHHVLGQGLSQPSLPPWRVPLK